MSRLSGELRVVSHSTKKMKQFTRTIEDFVCEHCETKIAGDGFTNHCSNCLYSKHVDVNPGDRANLCLGLMAPVDFSLIDGIKHRCLVCNSEKYNKVQLDDNYELIIELSATAAI
jgi:hypothetical protein